jgi:hypothetical protein
MVLESQGELIIKDSRLALCTKPSCFWLINKSASQIWPKNRETSKKSGIKFVNLKILHTTGILSENCSNPELEVSQTWAQMRFYGIIKTAEIGDP